MIKSLVTALTALFAMSATAEAVVESDWKCSTLEDGDTVICYDTQYVQLFGNNSTEAVRFYALSGKPILSTIDCQKRTIMLVGDTPSDVTTKSFGDGTLMSRMCDNKIPGTRQFGVPATIFLDQKR